MASTAWSVARRDIMRPLGLHEAVTTTNITTNQSVLATGLSDRFVNPDALIGWFLTVILDADGGTPANGLGTTTKLVTDYTASSGTLLAGTVAWAAEDEAVDFDLYLFHPDDILRAYNRARQVAFEKGLGIVRDIETLVTGPRQIAYTVPSTMRRILDVQLGQRYDAQDLSENLLINGGFENWSSATSVDNWSIAGSGASVNQEVATASAINFAILTGDNSARVVVPVTTVTTLLQTFDVSDSSYANVATEGVEINVSGWVYSTTADRIAIRIAGVDGTAHAGGGWERIRSSANLAATATTAAVGTSASSGAAMPYFVDNMIMTLGPSEGIELPWTSVLNWEHVPAAAGASSGGIIRTRSHLPSTHRLRLIGLDMFSAVTVDTSTIEADGDLLEPVYDLARSYLCEERANQSTGDEGVKWGTLAAEYMGKYVASQPRLEYDMPRPRLQDPSLVL
jgi:hypothetical protein